MSIATTTTRCPKILMYLAGAIEGLTWEEATGWREEIQRYIPEEYFEILNPMRHRNKNYWHTKSGKYNAAVKGTLDELFTKPDVILLRDKTDVKRADLIIVNFDKVQSIGTPIELGWANILQKPIIVIMSSDNRFSHHSFIHGIECAVVTNIADAIRLTLSLFNIEE